MVTAVATGPAPGTEVDDATDEDAPLGPFQRPDEDLVKQCRLWWQESSAAQTKLRERRQTCWKFYANDQWEKSDKETYKRLNRPMLTLNLVLSIVSAVEGEERTNRQEIKIYGLGQEDDGAAHALNRLIKWVLEGCGGEFSLSDQFRAMLIGGEGWVVPEVDYFDDPEGQIKLVFVDDRECFPDPSCSHPTAATSTFFTRVKMTKEDEIEARWPGSRAKIREACITNDAPIPAETDGKGYRDIYSTPNDVKSPKIYDSREKAWAVLESWWCQIEPGWVVVNTETGLLEEKTDAEFAELQTAREEEQRAALNAMLQPPPAPVMGGLPGTMPPPIEMPPPIQAKQRPIRKWYQAFTCYDVLLDKQPSPLKNLKRMPYLPVRGLFDREKGEWFGIVEPILDPQRQHNVEQSIIVQLMQLTPKQSWMGPKGAFHNKHEWSEKVAQPGQMLEYNAARGKPEPIPVQPIPRHLVDMAFTRPQSMREISGVNVELTGQRQGSDPGVVMEQRAKAAKTVLAPLFDHNRQSKKELGKILLSFIQTYVSVGRRVRVLGPTGAQYVEMTEQMGLARYDTAVEETNATINDRIATLNIMQTTLPTMTKAGMSVPPEFIDLLPMPPHVRDAMKRQLSWELTIAGRLPPPDWQPGMPPPMPGAPPGLAPPAPVQPPA